MNINAISVELIKEVSFAKYSGYIPRHKRTAIRVGEKKVMA